MAGDKKLGEIWAITPGATVDVRAFIVGVSQFRFSVGSEAKQVVPSETAPEDVSIQNRDTITTIEIGNSRGLVYGQGYPIPPLSEWSPLGGVRPLSFNVNVAPSTLFAAYAQLRARSDVAGDSVIAVNQALALPISFFRDLTINAGIVLTAGFRFQIVVCRNLIFGSAASRLTAMGLGYAPGAPGAAGSVGGAGSGPIGTDLTAGPAGYDSLFVLGGAGGTVVTPGVAARVAHLLGYLATLSSFEWPYGAIAGGGGGAGGSSSAGTAFGGGPGGPGIAGGGGGGYGGAPGAVGAIGGIGGLGGGVLIVVCDDVQGAAGIIDADGAVGGTPTPGGSDLAGGGGGGGGGFCLLFNKAALTITPTVRANGGAGGPKGAAASATAGSVGGAGIATQIALT